MKGQEKVFGERARSVQLFLLISAAILLTCIAGVRAAHGGGYELTWTTVDNGGVTFRTVGDYTLHGTIGQPDAAGLVGGEYGLIGGFWSGGVVEPANKVVYLPLVVRSL